MIYSKPAVILLSSVASQNPHSINYTIAQWLLAHTKELKDMTIKDVAEAVHAGIASVSRFVRETGFEDFKELKELLTEGLDPFEQMEGPADELPERYYDALQKGLAKVRDSLDRRKLEQCIRAIHAKKNIKVFSLLKGQAAAVSLAADLRMLGKNAGTLFSYKEQIEMLKNSTEDDLFILFSYTGSYFAYEERIPKRQEIPAPVIMISGGENRYPQLVDLFISFESGQSRIDHPYTMLFAAGLIAQMYAAMQRDTL